MGTAFNQLKCGRNYRTTCLSFNCSNKSFNLTSFKSDFEFFTLPQLTIPNHKFRIMGSPQKNVKVEVRIIRIDYYLADLVTVFYLFICFIISRIKESFCKGNVFCKITQACKLPRELKLKDYSTFFLNVAKVLPTFSIVHCFMKSSNSSLG